MQEMQETWVQSLGGEDIKICVCVCVCVYEASLVAQRSGRSPGEGDGYPFQYSCLEKPLDRGTWRATVQGFAKSRTQLSD